MNWKVISRNVGYALLVSALFMFLSIIVSVLRGNDSALAPLIISFTITFISGAFPFIFVHRTTEISLREGYVIITLSWLLSFVFGMLPYALWGGPFTLANAWFESVSGFTTTGATSLADVESLPDSLLFWRSSTHFIGGLGVVVFLLLIIPNASPVKLRLTNMELSSLSRKSYSISPNRTVYVFADVYLGICLLAFFSYWLAGMTPFDAICHAFSVCATGGFSTHNNSIAAFNSRTIEALTMLFMILSSLHFGLLYLCFVRRSFKPLDNPVIKFFLITLFIFSSLIAFSLTFNGVEPHYGRALWVGAFQTVSIASTTGFAIADNSVWPVLPNVLLMFMAVMCGCAGSTTGGLKADRVLVFFKMTGRQISRILHPNVVNEIKLGTRVLRDEEVAPHILYIALYCILLAISIVLSLAFRVDDGIAVGATVSSLGNVGPAMGELGTMGNYGSIPVAGKLLYTLDMFLGRIEIYPVLAVLGMIVDKRRRQR